MSNQNPLQVLPYSEQKDCVKQSTEQQVGLIDDSTKPIFDPASKDKSASKEMQIARSSLQLQKFTKDHTQSFNQLRTLSQLVPSSCKKYENAEKSYQKFSNVLNSLQSEYDNLQIILQKVKLFSQKTQYYLKNFQNLLIEQVEIGLPISLNMIEDQKSLFKQINDEYDQFESIYSQMSNRIMDLNLMQSITEVNDVLKVISQNYIQENVILKDTEDQRILQEKIQILGKFDSQIELLRSQISQTKCQNTQVIDQKLEKKNEEKSKLKDQMAEDILQMKKIKKYSTKQKENFMTEKSLAIQNLMKKKMELQNNSRADLEKIQISIQKQFEAQQQSLNSMSVEPVSFYKIFMIDESGSMQGNAFNSALTAVKETVQLMQKDKNCEDSFCLIQFNSSARIVINKKPIQQLDVNAIPNIMKGGNTNFSSAFQLLKDSLQLCNDTERPQIIFLTDGDSNNKSQYLKILLEISRQFDSKGISMFCLAYGQAKMEDLKDCLKIINKNEISLTMKNGAKVQTLYQISQPQEIVATFKTITETTQFNAYQISMKSQAIQDMSQVFYSQIEKQNQQALNSLNLQIQLEQQTLKELEEDGREITEDKPIENIKNAYQRIEKAIDDEISSLRNQHDEYEQQCVKYENQIKTIQKQKENESILIENLTKSNLSQVNLNQAAQLNQNIANLALEYGFRHFSKFQELNSSLDKSREKKEQLIEFLNQLQQYIESSKYLVDQIKITIKRFEFITKIELKLNNVQLMNQLKTLLNIDPKIKNQSEAFKQIIFNVDYGLQAFLKDNDLEEFFESEVLTLLISKLEYLQQIKVTSAMEDDSISAIDSLIEELFESAVEESEDLKDKKQQIKEVDSDIKDLKKQQNAQPKDKDIARDIKEKNSEKKEYLKEKSKLVREFNQENSSKKKVIQRSVYFLKTAIDTISEQAYRYRVGQPVLNFCSILKESCPSINQMSYLSLCDN